MRVLALALLLLTVTSVAQAAARPFIRVDIKPAGPVLVGQQLRVSVTVLAPNFFLSPPQFPLFDIPGAIVTLPDERAANSTETINGETYAGIRRDYLITPQRAGDFVLPPAQITFSYAAEPGRPAAAGAVTLPPQRFVAELPQGVPTAASSLVSEVVVTQTLEGDPKTMKVGDALMRTVEIFAPITQAMMISPPTFAAPDGVRVYPRDPVLTDVLSDHGGFAGGRRVDQATYVFERPGSYVLPAIEIPWIDAQSKQQRIAKTPDIDVAVTQAPVSPADLAPPIAEAPAAASSAHVDWRPPLLWLLGLAVVALSGFWMLSRFGPRVRDWARRRRQAREASEATGFARLSQACRAGDAVSAYRALGVWARRLGAELTEALCVDSSAFGAEVAKLEQYLYAGERMAASWDGRGLLTSAKAVRASRRGIDRRTSRLSPALPTLNPRFSQQPAGRVAVVVTIFIRSACAASLPPVVR